MTTPASAGRLKPHVIAIGLIVLLLGFVAAGTAYLVWKSYEDTRETIRQQAASASQVVSANVQWALEAARQVLRRVDDSVGVDLTAPAADAETRLADAIATLPGSVKVYVVDAGGTTRLTTDAEFKPIDVRDREYFSAVANGAPWHITSLLVSRLNGEQIFAISKRIERNGRFAGAAILSFNSDLLQEVWRSLGLDDQSTVGLFREDGQLVSRYPLPEGPLDLSKYVLFTDYLPKAPTGTYDAVSPADGVSRTVGYQRVPGTNLIALSSLSAAAAFAPFNAAAASILSLAIPALLGLGLAAYWTFRLLLREARQHESEAQFRVVAEAMPNHVWTSDPSGSLDWFNSRVYEFSGAAPGELDGQAWMKIVHPDDVPGAAANWAAALASEQSYETQFRLRRHDGAHFWHLARAVPIRGRDGKVARWIGTNTDIDQQKQTAEDLAESETRLRLAIEAGQLAVWELDTVKGEVTASPALNRLYGFPEDATPTVAEYQSRYAPGESERLARLGEEIAAKGGNDLESEVRHIWPDGTEKWLLIRAQGAAGGTRAIGVVIDITERKRVEQALRNSERLFRLSQNAAGIASLELDITTGTVLGTEKFWEIWGLPPSESVHISVLENIVVPEDKDVRSTPETRRDGTAAPNVEYRIRRPDTGEQRWLSRHVEFVHDEKGKPIKMYGVMQDITQQKEAQSRQELLTHELEHRIKNILSMVAAIASQTLRNRDLESASASFNERLRALSSAHDILTRTRWTEASMQQVMTSALAPLPAGRVTISGPEIALGPKMALSLALAVNELGTNALKYGALSNEVGQVDVRWSRQVADKDGAPVLVWSWMEMGGPEVVPPTRRGFGRFLIERVLAADFNGEVRIEYLPRGVECTLTAPFPSEPAAQAAEAEFA